MFCEVKVVEFAEFALDLDVIKTKIVSLSKKLFLVASIASPGSFQFREHDLKCPLARASGC